MPSSACFFYVYTEGFFLSGVIFLLLSQDIRIRTFKSGVWPASKSRPILDAAEELRISVALIVPTVSVPAFSVATSFFPNSIPYGFIFCPIFFVKHLYCANRDGCMKGAVDIYVVWLFPSTVCMFTSHNWLRGGRR